MPIVSRLITAAEWQAIEKKHNLDPKSIAELGFEGHWLIDGSSDADRPPLSVSSRRSPASSCCTAMRGATGDTQRRAGAEATSPRCVCS